MSQENFDDLLKQSFEKERDIPFDESAWQSLSGRLNNTRGFILPLWSILLLGLGWLFAAGLGIFMMTYNISANIPSEPLGNITANNDYPHGNPCDTIYHHPDTLFIRDTIYIFPSAQKTPASKNKTVASNATKINNEVKLPTDIQNIPTPLQVSPTSSTDDNLIVSAKVEDMTPIPYAPIPNNVISDQLSIDWLYKGSKSNYKNQGLGRFQIGITTGWGNILEKEDNIFTALTSLKFTNDDAAVLESEFDSVLVEQRFVPSGVIQQGINLTYRINQYFSAQVEFGQERIGYQYSSNPLSNGGFDIAYDSGRTNGEIDRLLSQRGLYYEIGFQSQLPRRLSPIINTRLRMRSHLSSITLKEIEPDGSPDNSGVFIVNPSESNERSQSKGLRIEQVRLGAGLQYQISRDWSVHSSFDSYLDIRDDGWTKPDWAINVGLKYRLPHQKQSTP